MQNEVVNFWTVTLHGGGGEIVLNVSPHPTLLACNKLAYQKEKVPCTQLHMMLALYIQEVLAEEKDSKI